MKAVNNFKKGTQKKWFRDNYVKPGAGRGAWLKTGGLHVTLGPMSNSQEFQNRRREKGRDRKVVR